MNKPTDQLAAPPILRLQIPEAADVLRCSRAHVYKLLKSGALRGHKDGKRRFVTVNALREYVDSLDRAAA